MDALRVNRKHIDELLRFLPQFDSPDIRLDQAWHGLDSQPNKDGVLTMPSPAYPPTVTDFFQLAGQPFWSDYEYDSSAAGELVHSDAAIASASLAQIKTMLTFCVRGERFCDGHWGTMIREGRIAAILRRLSQLREEVPDA